MASTFYEIVELSDGEIALQRADGDGEPLIRISLSEEVKFYLQEQYIDVARAMINAGVRAFGQLQEEPGQEVDEEDIVTTTLH